MKHFTFATLTLMVPVMLYACTMCSAGPKSPGVPQDASVSDAAMEATFEASEPTDASADADVNVSDANVPNITVDNTPFIDYIFGAIKEWAPPNSKSPSNAQCYWKPNKVKYQACIDATEAHEKEVAKTIVEVITDPSTTLPIIGDNVQVKSALLMASIAKSESGFRKVVDTCEKGGDCNSDGKNCIAWGLWQTHTPRFITCNNRASALRHAIKIVNQSFDACKNYSVHDRLAAYACGRCDCGHSDSEHKIDRAINYLKEHPFTFGTP